MGKAHSGKTSMRSIIFANYLARDTMRLSATLDVEHHHVRFLGDLVLNLWDCGGQDAFYESYFERDRETIFRSVELLIYVFDIASDCPEKDFEHFAGVLEAIEENSPDARIFVLVHKMDLVAKEEQEMILEDRRRLIEERCTACGVHNFQCFGTSIWDETLYKAWSEIVTNLIPNIRVLESHLDDFCRICDADEVVLFERATFLVISHSHGKNLTEDTNDEDIDDDDINQQLDNNNNNNNNNNNDHEASTSATPNNNNAPLDSETQTLTLTPSQMPSDLENLNSTATRTPTPNLNHNHNHASTTALDGNGVLTPTSSSVNDNTGVLITTAAVNQSLPPLPLDDDITSAASSMLEGAMPSSIDGNFNDSQMVPSVFSEVTGHDSAHPYQKRSDSPSNLNHNGTVHHNGRSNRSPSSVDAGNRSGARGTDAHRPGVDDSRNPPPQRRRRKGGRRRQQQVVLDTHRFEKISNIVKQFKLSCEKAQSQFQGMEVSNSRFTACIDAFTANTYIMVIVSRGSGGGGGVGNGGRMGAAGATTLLNIKNARSHFERFIPMS